MDLSTDLDFLSGALGSVSGISLVPQQQSSLKLDLESFHAKTLQWVNMPSPTTQTQTRTRDVSESAKKKKNGQVEIFVRTLTGKTIGIYVYLDTEYVEGCKREIEHREGVPPGQQRLMYRGMIMEDDRLLIDYGIEKGKLIFEN